MIDNVQKIVAEEIDPATESKNLSEDSYKKLPYNIDAEQYILGSILLNNEFINRVADFLLPEHFFETIHQRIFEVILNLYDKGISASPISLQNHFQDDEALKELGGSEYLAKLCSLAGSIVNVKDYGRIVYNLYISRKLIEFSQETINDAYKATGSERASEQIETPEGKLFALASEGNIESSFASISTSVKTAIEYADAASKLKGSISGVATNFSDMDNLLGGFNKSDLIILAARPSMGKTALALNFAYNGAEFLKNRYEADLKKYAELEIEERGEEPKKGSVGFISLEMSAEQLATRMLSMDTGINASNIRRGKLSKTSQKDEFKKLLNASNKLNELPIFIDDTPALSISAVRTRARRLKRKYNLELLIVDYLQLLRGVGRKSQDSRVQEISEITMGLKAIAKELNIPVIALSQLSRQVEQRADHRPQLSDLRESGSIEQDADIVMFIYREAYYKEREKPSETETEQILKWQEEMDKVDSLSEIIIAKNRNGPIDNVQLYFDKSTTRFANYAEGFDS